MKMLYSILFATLSLCSCRKPAIDPIPIPKSCLFGACDTSKLEIIWERPIIPDTQELASMKPLLIENEVLFSQFTFSKVDTIKFFEKGTGIQKKLWADYLPNRITTMTTSIPLKVSNKLIFTTWDDVYSINGINGISEWRSKLSSGTGNPFVNAIGERIYHVHHDKRNSTTFASYLVSANVNNGKWDTVHTQNMIDRFEPGHGRPALWVSPDRDSILVFQIRYVDFSNITGGGNRTDIVAYNTTKKQEYFRYDNIDKLGTGSVRYPYIVGNKVFIPLTRDITCIDMLSKTIKWQKDLGAGATFSSGQPFIYVENKLFVKPDNRTLYQLDMETGNIIWQDLDNGSGASDMVYYDGVLYYTCSGNGKIYAVEVKTGRKIWADPSPNKYKNKFNGNKRYDNANIGFGGVAIDSSTGYLYTSDFYFHICLKLPKK
jgi:outer membrane protein assembly factor BamB